MSIASKTPSKQDLEHKKLGPILVSYRRHLMAEGKSPATADNYLGAAAAFLDFAEDAGFPPLSEMRREHVETWLEALRKHYAAATVRNRFNCIRLFFLWLLDDGEIQRNPTDRIKRPALAETQKDVVTEDAIAALLTKLEKAKQWRELALVALIYDTGMRATEVADCLVEHVDLSVGTIIIPKTKARRVRMVKLSEATINYIDRYLRRGKRSAPEYLFCGTRGKLTRSGIYQVIREMFEAAGYGKTIGPHDLRHTSASHSVGHLSETAMMTLYGWSDADMPRHYAKQRLVAAAFEEHERASPLTRLRAKGRDKR